MIACSIEQEESPNSAGQGAWSESRAGESFMALLLTESVTETIPSRTHLQAVFAVNAFSTS